MSTLRDLHLSVRTFTSRPLYTAAILLSLAFGIGANTAIFSVLNTLMLRPLPVRDPATLFELRHGGDDGASGSSTYALYEHLKARATTVAGVFQVDPRTSMKVLVDGRAEAVAAERVTGDYFGILGIRPALGALIGPADQQGATRNRVAVISHAYWTRRFGGDPAVLGRAITVADAPHTIVGVTPPDFFGLQVGRHVDVTIPIDGSDDAIYWKSRAIIVRLASGVSRETATADLNVAFRQYIASDRNMSDRARAQSFKWLALEPASSGLPDLRDRYARPVQALLAIVSALLLLACANLASLFLARAAARQRDLAVCLALGASRARLARQLVAETLLVSVTGGALGVLVASWGVDALIGYLPEFSGATQSPIRPDANVLLFTLTASLLTGLGIGLAPAWLARKVDVRDMLAAGSRTLTLGGGAFRALIVVQVALSTVLVVAATLFTVSLSNLKAQSLGFVADGVLTLTADADGTGVEGDALGAVHRQILEKLQALPGVQHATFATIPPISGNEDGKPIAIPGVAVATPEAGVLQVNTVGPTFFDTFGVRILKGRGITAADSKSAPQVAVVSESMARYYFPGLDPIGRRMDVGRGRTGGQIEIVGVASDVRYRDLRTPAPRMVYVSAFQREAEETMVFAIRTAGNPAGSTEAARTAIQSVLPSMLTTEVRTLLGQRDERLVNERLLATLCAGFAVLALILAGIGVYGTVAWFVTQRTSELGVRIALGASRRELLWVVVRGTLSLIVVAAGIGLAIAFMMSSVLSSFLFGVQAAEPWVYSATVVVLVATSLLASAGPTLRALRIDPVESLRAH